MERTEIESKLKEGKITDVDLRFTDLFGEWQHTSVTPAQFLRSMDAKGYDGFSIRGGQLIHESDMNLRPDFETAFMDPFYKNPTLVIICDSFDPVTGADDEKDPRIIAGKAEAHLKSTGIADVANFGPEAEFFVFDDVKFDEAPNGAFYRVDSAEGAWNSGLGGHGHRPYYKRGYFPVLTDSLQDLRSEMVKRMQEMGIDVELHHHEVATAGQCEIDMKYAALKKMADNVMKYKNAVHKAAMKAGKTATFMPKPIVGDNGSGMHVHQSLWKGDQPLFADEKDGGLSEMALHYIAGIIEHADALCAIVAPTTNSYRRLVPGFEAPTSLVYSFRNRSAAIRIPMYSKSPNARRIEVRFPDPSCNPYLAFSAMLLAGLDGIRRNLMPPEPVNEDIYALPKERLAKIKSLPGSLDYALRALEEDAEFLTRKGVFTEPALAAYIAHRREEINEVNRAPTPTEFRLYFSS